MPSYIAPTGGAPEPLVDFGGDVGAGDDFVDFGAEPPTDEMERPAHMKPAVPLDDEETQIGVDLKALRSGGVTEGAYSGGGKAPVDTTDSGWESSVHSSSVSSSNSVLGRARGGSSDGPKKAVEPAKPMSTPAAPMQLFGDDLGGGADGLPGGMSDLSDFDNGGEGPPTEEVPSAVLEDLGQLYNASMSVPEPSPLPELFSGNDAATEPTGHPGISRTPPAVPKAPAPRYESSTPAPTTKSKAELPRTPPPARPMVYREEDDEEVELGDNGGWLLVVGGLIALAAVVGVIAAAVVVTNRPNTAGDPVPVEVLAPELPSEPAEVVPAVDPSSPEGVDPDAAVEGEDPPEDSDSPGEPAEDPAKVESPPQNAGTAAVTPPVETTPKVTPPPKPPPAEQKVYAGTGTIKIRANKRVIVQVNGNLLDFAPVDLPYAAGNHTVGAMLPGRPDSLQEKPIKLRKGKTVTVDFEF